MVQPIKHIRLQACRPLRKAALGCIPLDGDEARAVGEGPFHLRRNGNADDKSALIEPE
ncbi:hypothetical protein D3C71_1136680 [compost metagenome]